MDPDSDEMSVVDAELKVKGIEGLRSDRCFYYAYLSRR